MVQPSVMSNVLVTMLIAATAVVARGDQTVPVTLPPVVFEGFGLGDFKAPGSIAAALRGVVPEADSHGSPLDLTVRGPTGSQATTDQMATEIRSRIDDFGLSAGVVTTPDVIRDGPTAWVGGMQVESIQGSGRNVLELRTSVSQGRQSGVLGIEFGPRIERRLRRGAVLFLDGKAEAKALKSIETGAWSLPGGSDDTTVGVAARTGLSR